MDENQAGRILSTLEHIAVSLDRVAAALAVEASYKIKDEHLPMGAEVGDKTIVVLRTAEDLRTRALKRLARSYECVD
ncbi:MAG: hypothetical protein ACYTG3_08680 [Planctomycetota bacterium]|jgi:hypothetical protein